jgi:hypothetical protein
MNLDSRIIQKTIQSLLTDVAPNVLTTPDISNVVSLADTATATAMDPGELGNDKFKNDKHKNALSKKHEKNHKKKQKVKIHPVIVDAATALYEKLNAVSVELAAEKNTGCLKFQESAIDVHSQVPRPETFSDKFLSREMRECIKNDSKKLLTFECTINQRAIRLFFILFENNTGCQGSASYYKKYARRVFMWLHMISLKSGCIESLDIYIYLTPFKKELPNHKNEVIGPVNANTGYTYRCEKRNEIVVYREEEWFKVLLHETIHAFGNDFEREEKEYHDSILELKKIFSLPQGINIQLSETYSEIWARIMNIAFQTYFKDPPSLEARTVEEFKKSFDLYLELESIFSLYQCIKILDFMGINYQVLVDESEHSKKIMNSFYRENTNVFAYYVLTSILLHNRNDFFTWCIKNNGTGLDMFKVKATQREFIGLIASCYKKDDLLQKVVETEKKVARDYENAISDHDQLVTTMRMTIVGFD